MPKAIIGLVGEKASGKGTAADYLAKEHGASVHRFSASMKRCLEILRLPLTRENFIAFSEITRKAYGEELYAKVIAAEAAGDDAELAVVDGIRREADMSELKKLPGFTLVYVTAPAELRWERSRKRGEKEGETEMTFEQFMAEEQAPTERAIPELGANADHRIDNSGELDQLYKQLNEAIGSLSS
jgi:dephospho-CoA kinase